MRTLPENSWRARDERASIVRAMTLEGCTSRQIAERLQLSKRTIERWRNRLRKAQRLA